MEKEEPFFLPAQRPPKEAWRRYKTDKRQGPPKDPIEQTVSFLSRNTKRLCVYFYAAHRKN
jgi:hypothetical protein